MKEFKIADFPTLCLTMTSKGDILELQNSKTGRNFSSGIGSSIVSSEDFECVLRELGFEVSSVGGKALVKTGSISVLIDYKGYKPFTDSTLEQVLYIFDEYHKEAKYNLELQFKTMQENMQNIDSDMFKSFTIKSG